MTNKSSVRSSLITGGAGFIGSRLAQQLLAVGESVLVLDDLSTGRLDRLDPVHEHPRLSVHVGSAADAELVRSLVERADRVFHFAATLGVGRVIQGPVHCFENNVQSAAVVLGAAAALHRPVLFASSSEVYGKGTRIPFCEDDECCSGRTTSPRWMYAGTKAIGEALAFAHRQESGLPIVVARLFNTAGPGQSTQHGSVLPTFVRQALCGEPITVHGSGRQTRCFCHVADTVEALVRLMDAPGAEGQIVNVGGNDEVTMLELAKQVQVAAQSPSAIEHVPYEQVFARAVDDLPRRIPDLSRLERLTGFRPTIPLQVIIEDVIAETKGNLSTDEAR